MLTNFRNNFSKLAEALLNEGKSEKALKALNRAMEIMPKDIVPYNYFILPYADLYFKLNEGDKAEEIIRDLTKQCSEEIEYYLQFKGKIASSVDYDIRLNMHILQESIRMAKTNNKPDLDKELEEKFNAYIMRMNIQS